MMRSFNQPSTPQRIGHALHYSRIGLILAPLVLLGCTLYSQCRPMGMGITFREWDTYRNDLLAGNYQKDCIYTKVTENGEYSYNCEWKRLE